MAALGGRCFDCVSALAGDDGDVAASTLASLCTTLRAADQASRLEATLTFSQLGGLEKTLSVLHPPRDAGVSQVAWTLLGLLFADANVLSNRLGKIVFSSHQFLPALLASGSPLPMLPAQVLNNLLKSASKQSMQELSQSKPLMQSLLRVVEVGAATPLDWRHLYVALHSIMLLSIGGAHATLDELNLTSHVRAWMASSQPSTQQPAAQRTALSILFLWALHHAQQFSEEETCPAELKAERTAITSLLENKQPAFASAASAGSSGAEGPSPAIICEATLHVMLCERTAEVGQVLEFLASRVKDWKLVGEQAQARARSEDFKKDFEKQEQEKLLLQEREKAQQKHKRAASGEAEGKANSSDDSDAD